MLLGLHETPHGIVGFESSSVALLFYINKIIIIDNIYYIKFNCSSISISCRSSIYFGILEWTIDLTDSLYIFEY